MPVESPSRFPIIATPAAQIRREMAWPDGEAPGYRPLGTGREQPPDFQLAAVRRGSPDPAVCRTAGLPLGPALETSGRRSGKVRRPCHNLVRDCENSGKLFPACSLGVKEALFSNDPFPLRSWRLFGAGLQTPPSAGPQVSRWGRGWRPSVGEVARSGDLATTWSGIARTPGNYSRPVP